MPRQLACILLVLLATAACGGGGHPAAWRLTAPPDGDILQIVVELGDGCYSFDHIDVKEIGDTVNVEAYRQRHSGSYSGCSSVLQRERHTVQLKSPLGERTLLGCDPVSNQFAAISQTGCLDSLAYENPPLSADEATNIAMEHASEYFRTGVREGVHEPSVSAARLYAWQASDRLVDMGFDALPLSRDAATCPPAPSCGPFRLPADETGYLVTIVGLPKWSTLSPAAPGPRQTAAAWVSDSRALVFSPPG